MKNLFISLFLFSNIILATGNKKFHLNILTYLNNPQAFGKHTPQPEHLCVNQIGSDDKTSTDVITSENLKKAKYEKWEKKIQEHIEKHPEYFAKKELPEGWSYKTQLSYKNGQLCYQLSENILVNEQGHEINLLDYDSCYGMYQSYPSIGSYK